MMRLGRITSKETLRKFLRFGYVITRQRGSHIRLRHHHSQMHKPLTIPLHNKDIKIGLLHQLLKDAGISSDEFLKL